MGKLQKSQVIHFFQDAYQNGPRYAKNYFWQLFPILDWIKRYNTTWLIGDFLAGITVGSLVIPQALSYAKLAGLPVEYGLYTSFVGLIVYIFFATSKDVTIGPTAVLSQLVGQLLASSTLGLDPVVFTTSLAFLAGLIETGIGLLQLGMIVDLISVPVVVGFTTGAAFQIIFGQLSGILGIPNINTNDAPYLVLINTLKGLPKTNTNAYFGIAAVLVLVLFRLATRAATARGHKWFVWVGYSANAITLIVFTLISWLLYRNAKTIPIRIVGSVPKGLNYLKVPDTSVFGNLLSPAITVVVVGIIEHIAMVKAFGRLNGYQADSNQEIIALGFTNVIGPFFGGFSATGSLSRSSIMSRSGVKSPLAGVFAASLVLATIYWVTPAFYFVPNAVLSAIITVAITDLIAKPAVLQRIWDVEFQDFAVFFIAFWVTIFVNIEMAVYVSVAISILILLYRIARPQVNLLVRQETGWSDYEEQNKLKKNPEQSPYPGIFVFRIGEALTYPNASYLIAQFRTWVIKNTKYGNSENPSDLLWNQQPGSTEKESHSSSSYSTAIGDSFFSEDGEATTSNTHSSIYTQSLEPLRALVFDCSAINKIDATGFQALLDIKSDAERHSNNQVKFYFSHAVPSVASSLEYFLRISRPNKVATGSPVVVVVEDELDGSPIPPPSTPQLLEDGDVLDDKSYVQQFIHETTDDAVDAAAKPFQFGSFSSATVL